MRNESFDVIIIGGSFSGLAAAMGLGRALRKVLVIDGGLPANRFTSNSHNLLTHDGRKPGEIRQIAKQQVSEYKSVRLINGTATTVVRSNERFTVHVDNGDMYTASKIIFATGIIDLLPEIKGFNECWGKSVLHCPYCHGFEVQNKITGIVGNGDYAFEFGALISNWTEKLTIYTNGVSELTTEQVTKLSARNIRVVEKRIASLNYTDGYVNTIVFEDGSTSGIEAIYIKPGLKQHSDIPRLLGCDVTSDGYLQVDAGFRTTVPGMYACGDNVTRMRTVANVISMGTATAITLNKDLVLENF